MPRYVQVRSHMRRIGNRKSNRPSGILPLFLFCFFTCACFIYISYLYPVLLLIFLCIPVLIAGIKIIKWRRKKRHIIIAPLARDNRYIPDSLRRAVFARDRHQCRGCNSQSYLEMDHIIPRSKGGATSFENLQVLCRGCNSRKGNR